MERHHFAAFLSDLTGAGTRNINSILLFMFGTLLVGIAFNSVFAILLLIGGSAWWLVGFLVVSLLLLLVVSAGGSMVVERWNRAATLIPSEESTFEPSLGLVLLASDGPGRLDEPTLAKHVESGKLRYCWLICTPEARTHAEQLQTRFAVPGQIDLFLEHVRSSTTLGTFYAVRRAIDGAFQEEVPRTDLLVDVTGGTKVMSVAAALAASERRISIEYVDRIDPQSGRPTQAPDVPLRFKRINLHDVHDLPETETDAAPASDEPATAPV